ncbi:hypothetical protein KJ966_10040 [bacterium]|nr:hypothetical protein [bacterium]
MYKQKKTILFLLMLMLMMLMPKSDACAQGIILAEGEKIKRLFRDSSESEIVAFAHSFSPKYSKLILHLGKTVAFQRGGLFFFKTSRANLLAFSKALSDRQISLDLWMMDSFGADDFISIYEKHQSILSANLAELDSLGISYDGIVVDLEWINHPEGQHGEKLQEILDFLRQKAPAKRIKAFAPLIDNDEENRARGYDTEALKRKGIELIPMLYILDGGFFKQGDFPVPYLNDNRVNQLKQYYRQNGFDVAVSLESGLLLEKRGMIYFVKTVHDARHPVFNRLAARGSKQYTYLQLDRLEALEPFDLIKNDTTREPIQKGQILYWIRINPSIAEKSNFIWHYHLFNGS